jgi:mannose/fructose/N-acetylgalactosamine-specific phosphotransferase system component IID
MEYGANFFISDYGLRIVNSENVSVIWNISLLHGTSWYYDDLEQLGVAFVLSPATEKAWKNYQDRVAEGEIQDGFTIIDNMVEH